MSSFQYIQKIFLAVLVAASSASAKSQNEMVDLRNGAQASKQRVEHVYKGLQKLFKSEKYRLQYYQLWCIACLCKQQGKSDCVLHELFQENQRNHLKKPLEDKTLAFLESEGITHQGILDRETQNIIISSYYGSSDPKIVDIQYPVASFSETYIPFVAAIRGLFHIVTFTYE